MPKKAPKRLFKTTIVVWHTRPMAEGEHQKISDAMTFGGFTFCPLPTTFDFSDDYMWDPAWDESYGAKLGMKLPRGHKHKPVGRTHRCRCGSYLK
jgi:hypothetical protein